MIKQAVILAAGKSSRFWPINQRHKSLTKIMGKPLIFYTLKGLQGAGISEVVIVQGPKKDVEKSLSSYSFNLKIKYIIQSKPKGMGNALWQTQKLLKQRFLVLNAERVNVGEVLRGTKTKIEKSKQEGILFGQKTKTPELFGIVRFQNNKVLQIVEKPKKGKEPSDIKIVGIYILGQKFFEAYQKTKKHTYDFEDALSKYIKKNNVGLIILKKKEKEALTLKYPWHLFRVEKYLFDNFLEAKIEKSAKVSKKATIEGKVYIAKNVKIFENAVIKGPCYVGEESIIGNNVLIRNYVNLEREVLIGANSEITRSIFQKNVHVHSNFIGDSILARGCRFGAGTITANVRIDRGLVRVVALKKKIQSGLKSLGCIIGEQTKLGANCSLMPGVMIGSNCIVGPASLVGKNIKDQTLFYTKFKSIKKKAR